ncbi:MAG: sigma-70 family RNA polymerase sigma factor [Prevotella sp.]|nr:sigma-70 family RNA polymerase sigma factor [Prevotella sp.]
MENLITMTDEQLALAYIDGNNRAFDLLLSRNQSKLYSYILFVVHDRDTADDVFQETFFKVITKLHQRKYTTSGKFGAWIMRIAHNVIMDWYREQKSEKIVEPTEDNDLSNISSRDLIEGSIESQFVTEQVLADVKKMMNMLPPTQREVVFMRFYQNMSFKEIAEMTNVSINTALGRMRYAILNLRRMAKQHDVMLQFNNVYA